jgi:hypothetical protein
LLNFAVSLLGHQNICEGRGAHKIKKIMGDNQAAEMTRLEQKRDRKTTESNQGLPSLRFLFPFCVLLFPRLFSSW